MAPLDLNQSGDRLLVDEQVIERPTVPTGFPVRYARHPLHHQPATRRARELLTRQQIRVFSIRFLEEIFRVIRVLAHFHELLAA
jgi:hypothetical protein